MRRIAAFARQSHYRAHLAPIAAELGIELSNVPVKNADLTIVAGYRDLSLVRGPAVLVEHGAGQTYGKSHPAYPGGKNRGQVELFICPSQRVADLNLAQYPRSQAAIVGCPSLDRWIVERPRGRGAVGLAFHWEATVCPESRSAWAYYWKSLRGLAERWEVLGHAHPRALPKLQPQYRRMGIQTVDYDTVMREATVLVADNTSIMYEFAATGRPVVALNAPWYRRDVHHGLRFWDQIPGEQVDHPGDLVEAVSRALLTDPMAAERETVIQEVYRYRDGRSAARAAAAIRELVEEEVA